MQDLAWWWNMKECGKGLVPCRPQWMQNGWAHSETLHKRGYEHTHNQNTVLGNILNVLQIDTLLISFLAA